MQTPDSRPMRLQNLDRQSPHLALLMAAALALSACESAPVASADGTQGDKVTCTREYPTGSSIPTTRCRTAEQLARERDDAQKTVDQVGRSNARVGKSE